MFTGYFAKLDSYKAAGLTAVSICGKAPEWYDGFQYKKVAPKIGFFMEWKNGSHKGDNAYYVDHFKREVLDTLNADDVVNDLAKYCDDIDKLVLLCYEKPGDFCHRHLVSEWLTMKGHHCVEYTEPNHIENLWIF